MEDGGGPILGYVIEAKDFLNVDVRKTYFWSEGPQTEYLVKDLQTSHIYQFRVYAQNEAGRGEALLNKNVIRMKPASKKPPAPSRPQVEIEDDESVLLQWSIPEGLSDINFIIERLESKSDLWIQCNREIVLRKSYLITGLLPGKEYKFRVSCENTYGVGPPSEESENIKLKESDGEPPKVIVPVTDCFVRANDKALFSCEYSGIQPISVNWSKDGIRVREGLGASIATEVTKSSLTLDEVDSDDDECSVQCDLRNAEGKASSCASIKILCSPKISCPSSYKDGLTYDEGDNMRLKVTFSGKPTPKIRWFFNEKEPYLDDRVEVSQQREFIEIRIRDLKHADSGKYEFTAENEVGKDTTAVQVTVTGPPSPPSGRPSIEKVDQNEALLKWNPPCLDGGSSVFSYVVEMKKVENDEWQRFATVHDSHLLITDSAVLVESLFRIRAVNIYGSSEPSEHCQLIKDTNESKELRQETDLKSEVCNETYPSEIDIVKSATENFQNAYDTHLNLDSDLEESGVHSVEMMCSDKIQSEVTEEKTIHETSPDDLNEKILKPLKIMFVGTQTLIPMNILNYACSDVYVFEDVTHFAIQVMPQGEYIIQNIDNIFCYTDCWFTTILETCCSDTLLENDNVSSNLEYMSNFILQCQNFCLQNYYPAICDNVSGEYTFNIAIFEEKAFYVEGYEEIPDIQELVFCNMSDCIETCHADNCVQLNCNAAILIYLHPLVLDSLMHFISDASFSLRLIIDLQLQSCVTITENVIFSEPVPFEVYSNIEKATSMTHLSEQFETLAGRKCVAMTSYKPALSVLPISRTEVAGLKQKRRPLKETNSMTSVKSVGLADALSRQHSRSDIVGLTKETTDSCLRCGFVDICVCDILDDDIHSSLVSENYISLSMTEASLMNENNLKNDNVRHESKTNLTDYMPDWLRFVSPTYRQTNVKLTEDSKESKTPIEELVVERNNTQTYLKDLSVQELLNLAEEVERSFSQKAEHIESLENLLQEELCSLEKDLDAVHEIHSTFWNDSLPSWISPNSEVLPDDNISADDRVIEEDLIDFKQDVSLVKNLTAKQDEYAPEIITHLQNRVAQCGCRTRLYCSISGKPDPQIAWLKNGKLLPQSSRYVCSNLVEFGLYIDIFNTKSSDSGEYMCIATNPHGSAQTEAYLRIIGHREYSPEEPKFLSSPEDIVASQGDSITLEWKISGTPVPHVMWFKNTEKIETSLRVDTLSNHRGCCRIVLHNVIEEDGAIYTCYLENEAGSSVSTVLVTVTADDPLEYFENPQEVDDSTLGLLTVTNDTNIPSLQYYERLLNQKYSPLRSTTIKAKPLKREKCSKTVPGPPVAPYILNSGKTWVILSWSAPTNRIGNTRGLEYLIERRLLNSEHWKEGGRTQNTLFTVTRLKSGLSYVFRISAGTKDGWGPPVTLIQPVHCEGNTRKTTKELTLTL